MRRCGDARLRRREGGHVAEGVGADAARVQRLAIPVYKYVSSLFPEPFTWFALNLAQRATGTRWSASEARACRDSVRDLRRRLFARGREYDREDWDPSYAVPFKGPLLYAIVRLTRPNLVLETGVQAGVSTSFILRALRENGRGELVSFDLDEKAGWIVPPELTNRWRLHAGDSRVHLPEVLAGPRRPDLFFHDGLHTYENMMFEFRSAADAFGADGVIVSDDVTWNRSFQDFCAFRSLRPRFSQGIGIVWIHRGRPGSTA